MLSTIVFRGLKWGGRRIGDLIAIAVCVVIGGIAYQLWLYPHFWIAAGLSGFLILFWFTQNMGTPPEAPPSEPEIQTVSNNFGSASYASKQTSLDNPEGLTKGVFFGRSSHPDQLMGQGAPIFSKPESHTLIVARTGTGKGTRIIIPTLLRAMKTSAFVIDPDGENGAITARARALHNNVLIMDPWRQLNDTYERLGFPPATFNPLDMVDRKDPNCVAIALALGNSMSPSEG
jgi:type IV secretion system protein VirD4